MANIILVHGSWHGGWCFDDVAAMLRERGHDVRTPTLPGMGGSDAEIAAVTLDGWASFILDLLRGMGSPPAPALLAGHSRGGLVLSRAAELAPAGAIGSLAYICAMLLPPGVSRSEFKREQQPNPDFDAIIRPHPTADATIINPAGARAVFAQLSPAELADAGAARLLAEPNAPRNTPLELSEAGYGAVPRHYIECLHDRTIPLADQRHMQALQPCRTVTTLPADHSPFWSTPAALCDALSTIAEDIAA